MVASKIYKHDRFTEYSQELRNMGNYSSLKLLNRKSQKKVVLLIIGLEGAGKTTIAKGLAGELENGVVPTVGFSTVSLMFKKLAVVLYDLGGGPGIRTIWDNYFADVHGIVFVLDAADTGRLKECRDILMNILSNDKLSGKPLLVLGNKQDIPGALDEIDIVETLDLEKLVNERKCPTLLETCSALAFQKPQKKEDLVIQNSFKWLLSLIERDFEQLNSRVEQDMAIQREKDEIEMRAKLKRLNKESHPLQVGPNENKLKSDGEVSSTLINRTLIDGNQLGGSSCSGKWSRDSESKSRCCTNCQRRILHWLCFSQNSRKVPDPSRDSKICCIFSRRKCCMRRHRRTAPLECNGECSSNCTNGGDNVGPVPLWTVGVPLEESSRPLAAPSIAPSYPESPFELGEFSDRRSRPSTLQTMKG